MWHKIIYVILFLLFVQSSLFSEITVAQKEMMEAKLQQLPKGCDQSCDAFEKDSSKTTSFMNTLFISVLVVIGAFWMNAKKKKWYIPLVGILVSSFVMSSFFLQGKINTEVKTECQTAKQCDLPIENKTVDAFEDVNSDEFSTDSGDEFASSDEFSQSDSEFSEVPKTVENREINYSMIIEPAVLFILIAVISLLLKYDWFVKLRPLFLLLSLLYLGFYRGGCPCMISGFQNTALVIFGAKISWETTIWFLFLIPSTYLFGKIWCGWLCHLGAFQEFIFKVKAFELLKSKKSQKLLKFVQISVFVIWIVQMIVTKTNIYCVYDPFKVAFNLFSASVTGWILLAVLLFSSLFIYKPFCRSICPVGLMLGWISKIPGARKLDREDSCITCKSCSNSCQSHAIVYHKNESHINQENCIICGECISKCKKESLSFKSKIQKFKYIPVVAFLIVSFPAAAQWDCPSRLGASLKPVGESNLMWASELTTSAGFIGDYSISNLMWFAGLDYSIHKHTFYIERQPKNWLRADSLERNSKFLLFGLREGFYQYNGDENKLKIGIQTAKSNDNLLLNERIIGANYELNKNNFKLNALVGSVRKQFARNGNFCTLGYLYGIVPGRERPLLGNEIGQTNVALMSLNVKHQVQDEFGSSTPGNLSLIESGLIAYKEFGSWIEKNPFLTGAFTDINLFDFHIKPELLYQAAVENPLLIYSLQLEKQYTWENGSKTMCNVRYLGFKPLQKDAMPFYSFSNVFAGEVLRLDAWESPFVYASVKQVFPKSGLNIKLQYAAQTGENVRFISDDFHSVPTKMSELDLSATKHFGKLFQVSLYAGYLNYPLMQNIDGYLVYKKNSEPWGKIECRITY